MGKDVRFVSGKNFFSIAQAKNTDNDRKQHQEATDGTDNRPKNLPDGTDNAIGGPCDLTIRQTGDAVDSPAADPSATAQDAARNQHFAEKTAEVAGKSPEKTPTLETDSLY